MQPGNATPSADPATRSRRVRHSYLSDFIYGGIDGSVTTFAIVSGVAGAGLEPAIIVVLGCANLLGDGFSMAAANFLGVRADWQQLRRVRDRELAGIDDEPAGKRDDVRRIFAEKGLQGEVLDGATEAIVTDRERWADCLVREGHGLALEPRSPSRAAVMTFVSFFVIGALPLAPFIAELAGLPLGSAYAMSTVLVAIAMFTVGTLKCLFVAQRWWLGGLETLGVGGLAAALAYLVGWLLRGIV